MKEKETLIIITCVLAFILIGSIVLVVIEYLDYKRITTNESPLCVTANCAASSSSCGYFPFRYNSQTSQYECKDTLFGQNSPNVAT
jgi:hypothetical protein